jgi:hypothetical protein
MNFIFEPRKRSISPGDLFSAGRPVSTMCGVYICTQPSPITNAQLAAWGYSGNGHAACVGLFNAHAQLYNAGATVAHYYYVCHDPAPIELCENLRTCSAVRAAVPRTGEVFEYMVPEEQGCYFMAVNMSCVSSRAMPFIKDSALEITPEEYHSHAADIPVVLGVGVYPNDTLGCLAGFPCLPGTDHKFRILGDLNMPAVLGRWP